MQTVWVCSLACIPFKWTSHRKEHFHKCEQCDLAFLIQEILGRICKRTDKCNHCKYAQYQTGNLRTQMKMHSGEKLNQCNQCDYVYSDPSTLRTHLKRREKSNKCNQCDFASSRAGDLRRHLKTHIGEKSNKCNQCNFASTWPANLRMHLKSHSGEKSIDAASVIMHPFEHATWGTTWKHTKKFSSIHSKSLRLHFIIHSGEK